MQLWHGAYHSLDYYWILRQNSGLYFSPLHACNIKLGLDVEDQINSHLLTMDLICFRHLQAQILV